MKRLCFLAIALGLSPALSAANLSDVYGEALARDARFASARAAYRAAQERVPQGRAGLLPAVNLTANWRYTDAHQESDELGSFDQAQDSHGYSLALVQPLFRKQNFEQFGISKLQLQQAEYQLAAARQDLALRVARAYFDVLLAEDDLALARAQKAAIAEQLAQARRSFEVGTATITDTHEAQARFDLTNSQEIAALNNLEIRRRALETIIGGPAPQLAQVREQVPLNLPEPNTMDTWVGQAEDSNLQLLTSRVGLEIATRNTELVRGAHYPTLDLAASYTDNRNAFASNIATGIDSQTGVIGLEFAWTLYQGGLVSSQVREAMANRERAQEDHLDAVRQAGFSARQAFLGVSSGEAQVRALQQALTSSETQLESTKLGVEVGVRTGVDLLNARQQLFSARRDLAAARYQYILSGLDLKAAAGTLGEADLAAVDSLLADGGR
jgi:outer membrane protein